MSVIGIDFGNESCFVAVARAGGIETIDNDYSMRSTPSYVAFGDKLRILGVAAKNQAVTNLKNTVYGFKRYLGRQFDDPRVQADIGRVPFQLVKLSDGGVGIKVMYLEEEQVFAPEQITAMLFTKLKETAENAIQAVIHDCVISVPSYFTDAERRALLDAAKIAGLNVLRLLNETAAAALNYGIYKKDLPLLEESPRHVAIVDCGHSALQVSISAFNDGKLKILAAMSDPDVGGRNFDALLANHFINEFRSKYEIDAGQNPRAFMRLMAEAEKVKKQMSANATKLPLNIECLMNDKDVSSSICRQEFEEMSAMLFQRVQNILENCLRDSSLRPEDIHSVEIVGGSSRIPAIKNAIEQVFKKPPSTTLNQDEAVARGCALQCAILSPAYKVKEFNLMDVQCYPIQLIWDESPGNHGTAPLFPLYHPVPFTRMLTFSRKDSLNLKAVYSTDVPFTNPDIGKFVVNVPTPTNGEPAKIKVKARVDMHGIFTIKSAALYEKLAEPSEEVVECVGQTQEKSVDPAKPSDAGRSDNGLDNTSDESSQKKAMYKPIDLTVEAFTYGLAPAVLDERIMIETHMISRDRNERERLDSRNTLEEYIYELRTELVDGKLDKFVEPTGKDQLISTLNKVEEWLYDEGEKEKKDTFLKLLGDLKAKGNPIYERKREFEECPEAIRDFDSSLQQARKVLDLYNRKDPNYEHIPVAEMEKLGTSIKKSEQWLDSIRQQCTVPEGQLYLHIRVKSTDIHENRKQVEKLMKVVVSTSKPKPTQREGKEESKCEDGKPEIEIDGNTPGTDDMEVD